MDVSQYKQREDHQGYGEELRLARYDLVAGTSSAWFSAEIDRYAPSYDGSIWFAVHDGSLLAVAIGGAVLVLYLVYRIGRRVGTTKSTVVEIRRI